ncbi:hypothetical protein B296_00019131 [Ensete ventricosum]|uniref:Uncharacterized protein n=1 Tax=Ensete ventricosum TaxID=4639 RepID=A0A427A7F1_ENSVE|nr:hypothetical protein B296_00019131 [Ensete ventricosum]
MDEDGKCHHRQVPFFLMQGNSHDTHHRRRRSRPGGGNHIGPRVRTTGRHPKGSENSVRRGTRHAKRRSPRSGENTGLRQRGNSGERREATEAGIASEQGKSVRELRTGVEHITARHRWTNAL